MESPNEGSSTPAGKAYPGNGVSVWFDASRCLHFAECVRGLPEVFQPGRRPWVRPELGDPSEVARVVRRCPTGALHYQLDDGPAEVPDSPTRVHRLSKGPLLVRGDLLIQTPAGEVHEMRAVLCSCGRAGNLPFCDGACELNPPLGPRD
jgi:uncharacterized Fe-S cluster protein YjdI/CDGSH-type Zn-finger protein